MSILNVHNENIVSKINEETITICLWIPPYHPLDNLDFVVKEWVDYYLHIGVDDFISCNNGMDKFK